MLAKCRLLIAALLVSALTACGGSGTTTGTTAATSTGSEAQTQTQTATDSVNLSWRAPASRSDGTYLPISELAGYRVYMGTTSNDLSPLVDLNDEAITSYTIRNLSAGSYYFAISAYDIDGLESGMSQVLRIVLT